MAAILTIRDETTAGDVSQPITLEFPTEHITVREIIKERVYQEVQDYNRRKDGVFKGLVQPTGAETALNGAKVPKARNVDWKEQCDRACEAYEKRRVLVLAGGKQTTSLDEVVTITRGVEVTFLKLVPLVGG